jgi:hypothetical protein
LLLLLLLHWPAVVTAITSQVKLPLLALPPLLLLLCSCAADARTSRNSMTPSRAFFTKGVSVLIFMPGPAGMAQDATGLGLFSTCDERQQHGQHKSCQGPSKVSCSICLQLRMRLRPIQQLQALGLYTGGKHICDFYGR